MFSTALDVKSLRKEVIKITSGASSLDKILGGGLETGLLDQAIVCRAVRVGEACGLIGMTATVTHWPTSAHPVPSSLACAGRPHQGQVLPAQH